MRRSPPSAGGIRAAALLLGLAQTVLALGPSNSTPLGSILDRYWDKDEDWWRARPRGRRAISEGDMHLIVDLHNKLRGQVHPPASNMEHMVSGPAGGPARTLDRCRFGAVERASVFQPEAAS